LRLREPLIYRDSSFQTGKSKKPACYSALYELLERPLRNERNRIDPRERWFAADAIQTHAESLILIPAHFLLKR
jgi:hypothetical protein